LKRSDLLIRVVTFVVFVAIVAYAGYSVYETNKDPLKTVMAIQWDVSTSEPTEGYAVRAEEILSVEGENVYVFAGEGEKVSAGETIAMLYSGTESIERAEKMRELRLEIDRLSSIKGTEYVSQGGKESVLGLASVIAGGDLEYLDRAAVDVELTVFSEVGKYTDDELETEISRLEGELEALRGQASAGTEEIRAAGAGTFSSYVDGFENVSPEAVMNITPTEYESLWSGETAVRNNVFGKVVSGITWYYVTAVDAGAVKVLDVGENAVLDFTRTYNETVTMKVESIGPEEDGKCVVVFSSKRKMQDVASLRELAADIVFSRHSGIRVPKEAVHLDEDGSAFVYVLQAAQAHKAYMKIAAESGDFYLAEPEDGMLCEGAQIITRGSGLAEGKVVS